MQRGKKRLESRFNRYIGIDYSGAETADSSCKGIRVFMAEGSGEPAQVQPPPSPRRYWTRRGLAEWLCDKLGDDTPTIVGIDHAFSFPLAYFEKYRDGDEQAAYAAAVWLQRAGKAHWGTFLISRVRQNLRQSVCFPRSSLVAS